MNTLHRVPSRVAREQADAVPLWTPPAASLDDLEMLLLGAYQPLSGFLGQLEATRVATDRVLEDGTPWPLPLVLPLPSDIAATASAAGALRLGDDEGVPMAEMTVTEVWRLPSGGHAAAGPVRRLGPLSRGSYPGLHQPAKVDAPRDGPLLAVPLTVAPDQRFVDAVRSAAAMLGADVLLMPLVGAGRFGDLDTSGLVRVSVAIRELFGPETQVVPVPLARHRDTDAEDAVLPYVAAAYGATHIVGLDEVRTPPGNAATVLSMPPLSDMAPATYPAAVERELRRSHVSNTRRPAGIAVLLTGLSGSGKSTIARALQEALLERTDRTVTILDGDVVRRLLSSELGFSREHRELNVRRIGYVATEVARHGGIAICAPIAPYQATRVEFRAMVESVGQLLLVHVSTPLEVCESRDRKGLYAKARAGLIAEFTGISDPYEVPDDADLRIDTSRTTVDQAVDRILTFLVARRLIQLDDVEWT